jgi:hypothetical protein
MSTISTASWKFEHAAIRVPDTTLPSCRGMFVDSESSLDAVLIPSQLRR